MKSSPESDQWFKVMSIWRILKTKEIHSFLWLYLTINAPNFRLISLDRNTYKLDSKRNLPLLSKATQKNSLHRNKQLLYTGMLQYPLPITCLKASDYLYNKGEIDMNLNLVTKSKVTEWNGRRIQFLRKNQCHWLGRRNWQDYTRRLFQSMCQKCLKCVQTQEGHYTLLKSNDCDLSSSCDIDFCVKIEG